MLAFARFAVPLAIGVHLTAALALLVLAPRNRLVRWYAAFQAGLLAWLTLLAVRLQGLDGPTLSVATSLTSHALPLLFLAFALVLTRDVRTSRAIAMVGAGMLLAPFTTDRSPWSVPFVDIMYQATAWITSGLLLARARGRVDDRGPGAATRWRQRRLLRLALAVLPLIITVTALAGDDLRVGIVAPLASTLAQWLVLFGAVRLQLYGLSVRAERTGALARDAAELERLALLGELGAMVAHEVRNPLTGIRSLAQRVADDDVPDPVRRAQFGRLIVSEVDRLDGFVRSMLALARDDGGDDGGDARDATTLESLLDDVRALVASRAARRGVLVEAHMDAPAHEVPRGPLAQVLLNLLLNAIDHSPEGGAVTVAATRAAGGLDITVRDQGPGVSTSAREALFTPFAPGSRGTGLGLAVVRRVADAHGWRVELDAAASPGACFRVHLPTPAAR